MTLQQFIEKWNGNYLEVAGSSARNQCVDLANGYIRDVLGLPIIEWTNAIDFPTKAGDNYDYILNTPDGVPQEGDLVIFRPLPYGHISVFIEGNTSTFRSFDQNYPTGSPCHVQPHTYANVIGWLRPKIAPKTPEVDEDRVRGLKVLDEYRFTRVDGAEGNFEGYVRAIVGRDSRFSSLMGDLSVATNKLQETIDMIRARDATISDMLKHMGEHTEPPLNAIPFKPLLKEVFKRLLGR